jgi:hypothetical protein
MSKSRLYDSNLIQKDNAQFRLVKKHIDKIKLIAIKEVKYLDYKEAYDYVDNIFPCAKVKNVIIYKVAYKELQKMGFGGAEGFYHPISNTVVLSGYHKNKSNIDKKYCVQAKVEKDEVIVHELCHYCYEHEGLRSNSVEIKEEFAYGFSIGYLRKKGYSDDYIIKYNFLPHLVNISLEEATKNILAVNRISIREYNNYKKYEQKEFNKIYGRKIILKAKELAIEKGKKIISKYNKKINEQKFVEKKKKFNEFELLDI